MWKRIASIYENRSRQMASLFYFRERGSRAEIVTPFLDPHNQRISLFLEEIGDEFAICDGGLGTKIAEASDPKNAGEIVESIVRDFGLARSGTALVIRASEDDLMARQLVLCNALIALMDRVSVSTRK